MEQELKFINMLGFKISNKYKSGWEIIDKNKVVGFIRQKKIKKKNNIVFCYITEINSNTIYYKSRKYDDDENKFNYSFKIKDNSSTIVDLNCGINPKVSIQSKEFGYINFNINNTGLYCSFQSKTENYNIEEIITYNSSKYTYQINYCDKDLDLNSDNNKIKTRIISATSNSEQKYKGKITLKSTTYYNKREFINDQEVDGTISEVVIKNEMGIEAINHLRYRLNTMLPFKEELLTTMLQNTPYLEIAGINLFLPDIIKNNNTKILRK